ncbi:Protein of unknown function [Cotesia congregata]|uniref:Uncharacterized protein n=1 Tax=Cotesia congregata TaxID=51543 RepID=A0A8J2HKH1_COTCN|nr:Protein of unknown function [Cotesia congregata]
MDYEKEMGLLQDDKDRNLRTDAKPEKCREMDKSARRKPLPGKEENCGGGRVAGWQGGFRAASRGWVSKNPKEGILWVVVQRCAIEQDGKSYWGW